MTLLSGILPGLRDWRTTFGVGSIWALLLIATLALHLDQLRAVPLVAAIIPLVNGLSATLGTALVLLTIYLIGIVTHGMQLFIWNASIAGRKWPKRWAVQYGGRLRRWIGRGVLRPSRRAGALLNSTIREALSGVDIEVIRLVPLDVVLDEFSLAALRLSKDAPEQYQHYDRVRAEADFRAAAALPTTLLGLFFAVHLAAPQAWLLAVATVVVGVSIGVLGLRKHNEADELLAAALYFGYSATPLLESLSRAARQRDLPQNVERRDRDLAWVLTFFHERGLGYFGDDIYAKARHPSQQRRFPMAFDEKSLTARVLKAFDASRSL